MQVRVWVTHEVQYMLSEAVEKSGLNRSVYLQELVAEALQRDLGVDAHELMIPPHPQSSVAKAQRGGRGGLRTSYTAKQPSISFMAAGRVPSLLYEAAKKTGLGPSPMAYVRKQLRAKLAEDLQIHPGDIPMPRDLADVKDHPVWGNHKTFNDEAPTLHEITS